MFLDMTNLVGKFQILRTIVEPIPIGVMDHYERVPTLGGLSVSRVTAADKTASLAGVMNPLPNRFSNTGREGRLVYFEEAHRDLPRALSRALEGQIRFVKVQF